MIFSKNKEEIYNIQFIILQDAILPNVSKMQIYYAATVKIKSSFVEFTSILIGKNHTAKQNTIKLTISVMK